MNFPNGFHFKNLTKETLDDLHNAFYDHFEKYDFEIYSEDGFFDYSYLKTKEDNDLYLYHTGKAIYGFAMLHEFFEYAELPEVKVKLCIEIMTNDEDCVTPVEGAEESVRELLDEIKATWKDFDYEEIFE